MSGEGYRNLNEAVTGEYEATNIINLNALILNINTGHHVN
jgi:hypothetical protein